MSKKPIILIGGGGHCRSVIEVIHSIKEYEIIGIIDKPDKLGQKVLGYKVIGVDKDIAELSKKNVHFVITAGYVRSPRLRITLYNLVKKSGGNLPSIVASTAYVARTSEIGEGTVIMHRATVNSNVKIGSNTIINTGALIEHDSSIGNHSHISTCAVINGEVNVSKSVFVGSNATINQNINIGEGSVIGSGSVVLNNVIENTLVVGNPGRVVNYIG